MAETDQQPNFVITDPLALTINQVFMPIPASVCRRKDLSANSKVVYGYLCACFTPTDIISPKISTIALECGLSENTVTRSIAQLKKAGLIKVRYTGRESHYYFTAPSEETEPLKF